MKKLFLALMAVASIALVGCEKKSDSTPGGTSKKVETISATDITSFSALLTGQVGVEIADYKSIEFGMLISQKESDVSSYEGKKLTGDKLLGQTFSVAANGLSAETQYYYRAYLVLNAMQYEYGDVKSFKTEKGGTGGNHQYVDLGLPSGIKWATCNVGASNPEEYGDYFAWGEVEPYYSGLNADGSATGWKEGKSDGYCWQSYCGQSSFTEWSTAPYDATTKILKPENDAARQNWGGNWRMPTIAEQDELLNTANCTWTWKSNYNSTGVAGYIVTSKKNGNTIFLPAAGVRDGSSLDHVGFFGNYWSSSLYESGSSNAYYLYFGSNNVGGNYGSRYYGQSVRPVCQ